MIVAAAAVVVVVVDFPGLGWYWRERQGLREFVVDEGVLAGEGVRGTIVAVVLVMMPLVEKVGIRCCCLRLRS